ncbi:serine hydrolase domain-containing protein [Allorhizocola rhizosphaerae]|uniref:serine hydrolase domain-containing protein n=1 Tax=Allorhizocola rhizosphaerae TaxID=1872709 RepID=UPI000E3D9EBC|nr:serine hydrolase domain-containing protein [Allorhizocola rhizosphaerae]
MHSKLFRAALIVLAAMGPTPAQAADNAELDRHVTDYMGRAGYPGVAIAVTHGDRVVVTAGYGRDSTGAPMTAQTPMPVASVSKSFTALAVMQLVEAGKIVLDEPVRTYLPDFEIADPRGARITARQLLNHTSGITDRTLPEKSLPQPESLAGALRRARAATLAADPGAEHHYTNTNYHLAARLVEVVAGQPFGDYLRDRVLAPLGMRASRTADSAPVTGLAKGHIYAYGASIPTTEPDRFLSGSDDLITTAEDMAHWLIMHSGDGQAANGTRLVSQESLRLMHASTDPRWDYGLGWATDEHGRPGHSGIWFTYTAYQRLLPSGHGIAVMANSGIGLGNEGPAQFVDNIARIVEGSGTPDRPAPLRLIIDLVLGALTIASLGLGIRTIRRAPLWAQRLAGRPMWMIGLRLLPRFIPLALLLLLPFLLGELVGGGRDMTQWQLLHYSVPLMVWSGVATLMGLSVVATRVTALVRLRRVTTG